MLFFFKKALSTLLEPLPLLLLLMAVGWLFRRRRWGPLALGLGLCGLIGASLSPVATCLVRPLESRYPTLRVPQDDPAARQAHYIVVLGAGHAEAPAYPAVDQVNGAGRARLLEAIRLHRLLPATQLLLSGGTAQVGPPYAEVLAHAARELGVEPSALQLAPVARDTEDEARLMAPLLGATPFVLVTTAVHLPRAMALFAHRGLHPIPAPADHLALPQTEPWQDLFVPRPVNLLRLSAALHEYLGLAWSHLRGQA